MRSQVQVEVRDSAAEHIDVHYLRRGRITERPRSSSEGRPKGTSLFPIQIGDVRDVPLRFEIGKSENFAFAGGREAPQFVFPNLGATKFLVPFQSTTEDATGACFRHGGFTREGLIN